jgi:putative hydrolase of the HAD superfamily
MAPPDPSTASVRLLIFDVDGVLFRYDRAVRARTLASELGRSFDAVWDAVFTSGIEARGDAGELDTEEYLAALSDHLGLPVPREAWVRSRAAAMTPDFDVLGLAARACRTVPVAALSNNPALLKEEAPRIAPELAALVRDRLFVGGELRVAKPHPTAYWAVTDRCRVKTAEALFVDDDAANVEGARDAGLEAHRFTTAAALEACLTTYGLLPPPGADVGDEGR